MPERHRATGARLPDGHTMPERHHRTPPVGGPRTSTAPPPRYPFRPLEMNPWTMYRCANTNSRIIGSTINVEMAMM